eukprot:TRINITY_DN7492_c0_g2_i3.p1 TRINITY_DN7492_c0_g2~~TRINITY_DN7492_c0_g2_i3.p1  ORF type:complete len:856 (+),score=182.25 TRINITY_DN7492_c0_g2_i3:104-2671(+)
MRGQIVRVGLFCVNAVTYRTHDTEEIAFAHVMDQWRERNMLLAALQSTNKAIEVVTACGELKSLRRLFASGLHVIHISTLFNDNRAIKGLPIEDRIGHMSFVSGGNLKQLVTFAAEHHDLIWVVHSGAPLRIAHALADAGAAHVISVERRDRTSAESDPVVATFFENLYKNLLGNVSIERSFVTAKDACPVGRHTFTLLPDHGAAPRIALIPTKVRAAAVVVAASNHSSPIVIARPGKAVDVTQKPPPCNLPAVPIMHSRELNLQKVVVQLRKHRQCIITGAVGVGKSLLAISAAGFLQQRRRYVDGVYLVNMRSVKSADEFHMALSTALNRPHLVDTFHLLESLADYKILLVLDNTDEFVPQVFEWASVFLKSCTRSSVLVTANLQRFANLSESMPKLPYCLQLGELQLLEMARMFTVYAPKHIAVPLACLAGDDWNYPYATRRLERTMLFQGGGAHPLACRILFSLLKYLPMTALETAIAQSTARLPQQPWARDLLDDRLGVAVGTVLHWLQTAQPDAWKLLCLLSLLPVGAMQHDLNALFGIEQWQAPLDTLVHIGLCDKLTTASTPLGVITRIRDPLPSEPTTPVPGPAAPPAAVTASSELNPLQIPPLFVETQSPTPSTPSSVPASPSAIRPPSFAGGLGLMAAPPKDTRITAPSPRAQLTAAPVIILTPMSITEHIPMTEPAQSQSHRQSLVSVRSQQSAQSMASDRHLAEEDDVHVTAMALVRNCVLKVMQPEMFEEHCKKTVEHYARVSYALHELACVRGDETRIKAALDVTRIVYQNIAACLQVDRARVAGLVSVAGLTNYALTRANPLSAIGLISNYLPRVRQTCCSFRRFVFADSFSLIVLSPL